MTVTMADAPLTDPAYVNRVLDDEVAAGQEEILALWQDVLAGVLPYATFISLAASIIVATRTAAWRFADVTSAHQVVHGSDIAPDPIGYDAPRYLVDVARAERNVAALLAAAETQAVDDLLAEGDTLGAYDAQDELRGRRLTRMVENEVSDAYVRSQGVAVQTYGDTRLVQGWIRQLGPARSEKRRETRPGRGRSRGRNHSPCDWCVTLNGNNAVRPAYYAMGRHTGDRCHRAFVTVPLSEIGYLWRNAYARRLGIANGYVGRRQYGTEWSQPIAA